MVRRSPTPTPPPCTSVLHGATVGTGRRSCDRRPACRTWGAPGPAGPGSPLPPPACMDHLDRGEGPDGGEPSASTCLVHGTTWPSGVSWRPTPLEAGPLSRRRWPGAPHASAWATPRLQLVPPPRPRAKMHTPRRHQRGPPRPRPGWGSVEDELRTSRVPLSPPKVRATCLRSPRGAWTACSAAASPVQGPLPPAVQRAIGRPVPVQQPSIPDPHRRRRAPVYASPSPPSFPPTGVETAPPTRSTACWSHPLALAGPGPGSTWSALHRAAAWARGEVVAEAERRLAVGGLVAGTPQEVADALLNAEVMTSASRCSSASSPTSAPPSRSASSPARCSLPLKSPTGSPSPDVRWRPRARPRVPVYDPEGGGLRSGHGPSGTSPAARPDGCARDHRGQRDRPHAPPRSEPPRAMRLSWAATTAAGSPGPARCWDSRAAAARRVAAAEAPAQREVSGEPRRSPLTRNVTVAPLTGTAPGPGRPPSGLALPTRLVTTWATATGRRTPRRRPVRSSSRSFPAGSGGGARHPGNEKSRAGP